MAASPNPKRSRGRPRTAPLDAVASPVQALDRGIQLLRALSKGGPTTLTDLSLRVGMPPSSAHRMLVTLQKHAVVAFDDSSQEWMIGVEAFRIGSAFIQRTNLVEAGRSVMHRLVEETGETANLAIANQGDVVFLGQVEAENPIRAFFRPGTRGCMHASGIGKALLAELSRREVELILQEKGLPEFTANTLTSVKALFEDLAKIRRVGWSFDDEETYSGMRCVAAPIYNIHGEAIAGISVSGPTVRFHDQAVAEIGPKVKRAAAAVTELIGGRPPERGADGS